MNFLIPIPDRAFLGRSPRLGWVAQGLAEFVIDVNRLYLRTHKVPSIYEAGVVYREEPANWPFEEFAPIPQIIMRGWGDCDDLVPWRVAELREAGEEGARVRVVWQIPRRGPHQGRKLFHLLAVRADGREECPSAKLGMR